METLNPYAPPKSSEHAAEPGSVASPSSELRYATFWRRFGGFWLDALIVGGLGWILLLVGQALRTSPAVWLVPGLLIGLFFNVLLVHRRGGTPGMLILKMRMAMKDGSAVTLNAAAVRYSVLFVLSLLSSIGAIMGTLAMGTEAYYSLGFLERGQQTVAMAPSWYRSVSLVASCWIWSEWVSMLFNQKRRAIQDFMAGTIVLHETHPPAIIRQPGGKPRESA